MPLLMSVQKRGLGKGGAAAHYCTMSVASRMAQFPEEPFEERLGSLNQSIMWCLDCGKPISHQTRTCVKQHIDSTHSKGTETLKRQKAKRKVAAQKEKATRLEWWETWQSLAFRDSVLSLILLPTLSGAVERFFSMAGTVTDAQHALSDNVRCMRFMVQFNGDIEERLV